MAPLPPSNTGRYWLEYTDGFNVHEMLVRYNSIVSNPSDVSNALSAILNFIENDLPNEWAVLGARAAPAGQEFSTEVDLTGTGLLGFVGASGDALPAREAPRQWNWVGRSLTDGRRVRLGIFGVLGATPANYRVGAGEISLTSGPVIAALNAGAANGRFITIGNSPALWRSYVNVNYNSHWETEARG